MLDRERDAAWMQYVAKEMNLSETAFLLPAPTASVCGGSRRRRGDLCGHATLASAHALWEERVLEHRCSARFHTRSGLLTATRAGDLIELDFPATPEEPAVAAGRCSSRSASCRRYVGRNQFDYLVEVETEAEAPRAESRSRAAAHDSGARRDRHQRARPIRASISSRASSPPAPASTKTRSPARRTAA